MRQKINAPGFYHDISRYSYNNPIIVVANVIILKFLSARFVDPGAPQLTILFLLTRVRT